MAKWTAEQKRRHKNRVRGKNYRRRFPLKEMLRWARQRSQRAGIPFDLNEADFTELPTHCPILGIPLVYGGGNGSIRYNSATLDRINNEFGYVRDNVIIISARANVLKNDASADELLRLGNFYQRGNTANTILGAIRGGNEGE